MKKLIAIVLLLFLVACNAAPVPSPDAGESSSPPPEPPVALEQNPMEAGDHYGATTVKTTPVRWLIPVMMGADSYQAACERLDEILNRVNAKLEIHDIHLVIELRNTTLTRELWPPNWREDKRYTYSVMNDLIGILTSKEDYDLISVPTGHASVTRLADMGLLRNVATDLHNYPAILDVLDPQQLETIRYNSGVWGIPAGFDAEENLIAPYLTYHIPTTDALGLFDVEDLNSLGDLLYAADRAANSDLSHAIYIDYSLDAYRREYAQFPFKVSEDYLFLYTQDGQVAPYAGSSVMVADIDTANRIWRVNGTPGHNDLGLGPWVNFARDKQMFERDFDLIQGLTHVPDEARAEYGPVLLADEKPHMLYENPYGTIVNVIPTQGSAYGLLLLDAIYSDRSIYEEFRDIEGLFGTGELASLDFGKTTTALIYGLSPSVSVYPSYYSGYGEYITGRMIDIHHFNLFDCVRQRRFDPNDVAQHYSDLIETTSYRPMPWDGFVFDPTPVMAEYTHVAERSWGFKMEIQNLQGPYPATSIPDIFIGLREVSDLSFWVSEIENAGLDIVLDECRRQYEAYLNGTNWQEKNE